MSDREAMFNVENEVIIIDDKNFNLEDLLTLDEQECDEVDYDFDIKIVATKNVLARIKEISGNIPPEQIIIWAQQKIRDKYQGRNKDYLQVFHFLGYTFWAISNKSAEECVPEEYCLVTYLDPSEY